MAHHRFDFFTQAREHRARLFLYHQRNSIPQGCSSITSTRCMTRCTIISSKPSRQGPGWQVLQMIVLRVWVPFGTLPQGHAPQPAVAERPRDSAGSEKKPKPRRQRWCERRPSLQTAVLSAEVPLSAAVAPAAPRVPTAGARLSERRLHCGPRRQHHGTGRSSKGVGLHNLRQRRHEPRGILGVVDISGLFAPDHGGSGHSLARHSDASARAFARSASSCALTTSTSLRKRPKSRGCHPRFSRTS